MIEPKPGTLAEPEMHARLVEALGVFIDGELDALLEAARDGLDAYSVAMQEAMRGNLKIAQYLPYVLYRTLGPSLPDGAAAAAGLWGFCSRLAVSEPEALRAAGHVGEGPALGNDLFNSILNSPSGLIILKQAVGDASQWRRADGKINLLMGEMSDEIDYLKQFKLPKRTDEFPLVLSAGERRLYTVNTVVRDPDWMKSNNPASLFVHPSDAAKLGIEEAGRASLVTKRGKAEVLVELDDRLQEGSIALPNGLGSSTPMLKARMNSLAFPQ